MERLQYQFLHQFGEWLAYHICQYLLNNHVAAIGVLIFCPRGKLNSHWCRFCGPLAVKYLDKRRHRFSSSVARKNLKAHACSVAEQFAERHLLLCRKLIGG